MVLSMVAFTTVSGCAAKPAAQPCDDAVESSTEVPQAMRDQELGHGVGQGDVWFVAPEAGHWSDLVTSEGGGAAGKFPMWIGGRDMPQLAVVGVKGTEGTGRAQLAPTSEGIPGPLPMRIEFPGKGCWQVTAKGKTGTARIEVHVKP